MMRTYHSVSAAVGQRIAFFRHRIVGKKKAHHILSPARRKISRLVGRALCLVVLCSLVAAASPFGRRTIWALAYRSQVRVNSWTSSNSLPTRVFRSLATSYGGYEKSLGSNGAGKHSQTAGSVNSPQTEGYAGGAGLIPAAPNMMPLPPDPPPTFTEPDPLVAGCCIIRAVHITELRDAVNLVRARAGLPPTAWDTVFPAAPGNAIKAAHILDLRTSLDQARQALGMQPATYSAPAPIGTGPIRAAHVQELRDSVKETFTVASTGSNSAIARLDPMNETGGGGENPLSRNFNWSLPLLSLPGRAGLNLGLSLSYNSLVWTRSGNTISFDDDHGFPGPGFRLGFPSIQGSYLNSQTGKSSYLLIGSDGGHTELRQLATNSVFYESADSAHLLLDVTQLTNPNDPSMLLRATDGTQLSYKPKGAAYECTEIKDRNGNFITINYHTSGAAVGRIANVHDTLDRVITFNYDANGWLTSITQDWKRQPPNQTQVLTHTWASFAYVDLPIQTNFAANLTVVGAANNTTKRVLSRVTLDDNSTTAANNSHSDFEYTPFGQVWKISNFAADNHLLNYRAYKLPKSPLWTDAPAQGECPRFTERRDLAQNWNRQNETGPEQEAITTFTAPQPEDAVIPQQGPQPATMVKVTQPNLTFDKIYFVGTAGTTTGWKVGLPYLVDSYDANGTIPERQVATTWNQDDESQSYILNPRVSETNVYDRFGNRKKTVVTFAAHSLGNGTTCQLPEDVKEYADATTVLRTTRTTYIPDAAYETRRMILPKEKLLYEGIVAPGNLRSKLEFKYDEASSIDGNDAPVQHDSAFGSSFLAGRGNLTAVIRYNVDDLNQFTTSTMKYNTAGAVVSSKDALQHEVKIDYTDSFSNSVSQTTLAYPTKATDADGYYSTTKYNFDFGAITSRKTPPANYTGNPNSQPAGPEQQFLYDDLGRLERTRSLVNNAYTRYEYPVSKIRVDTFSTLVENQGEAHSFQITDGFGRAIATGSDHPATPGTTARFDAQRIVYDVMGRVFKTSNPAETSASGDDPSQWALVEGDAGSTWVYTQQTYDWKGRPLVKTNPDNTTEEASYTGCGCAGGEVVTQTDEGTVFGGEPKRRQQKIYSDVLGRTIKTEVLNWQGGSVYSTIVNTYNARDQVTLVRQYDGTETGGGTHQDTTMTYDGYGRLRTKHTPQQQVDPNNGVSLDHTTWEYKADDTVLKVTDARGAYSTRTYNNRHLLTGIEYGVLEGVPTTGLSAVAPAAPVSFVYDAVGNRTSMSDGPGSVSYSYDQLSRLTAETRTFVAPLNRSYSMNYDYNLAGELKQVSDPFGASFYYERNQLGQLKTVTGSPYANVTTYLDNVQYRAWGAVRSASYGNNSASTTNYDERLNPHQFRLTSNSGQNLIREDYTYFADGNLRDITDLDDRTIPPYDSPRWLSRAFAYDQKGRIADGHGSHPPFFEFGPQPFPFQASYTYDAFDNLTSRFDLVYYDDGRADDATFTNNRRNGWTYDADGRMTFSAANGASPGIGITWRYDAAGQLIGTNEQASGATFTYTASYDGDGRLIYQATGVGTAGPNARHTMLYSTALNGELLTEVNAQGNKERTHVPAGGLVFPKQNVGSGGETVNWIQRNPQGNTETAVGGIPSVYDPLGNYIYFREVPLNWFAPSQPPDSGMVPMGPGFGGFANMYTCFVDGAITDCNQAMHWISMGVAAQCPNNDCGPRFNPNRDGPGRGGWDLLYLGDDGFFYSPLGPSTEPEQTSPPQNPAVDVSKVDTLLKNPTCRKFLNGVLMEIDGSAANQNLVALLDNDYFANYFHGLDQTGAFHNARLPRDRLGETESWSMIRIDVRKARPGTDEAVEYTAIHESFHPVNGSQTSHFEMATAAYNVGRAQGLFRNVRRIRPVTHGKKTEDRNSYRFDRMLFIACPPAKTPAKPPAKK